MFGISLINQARKYPPSISGQCQGRYTSGLGSRGLLPRRSMRAVRGFEARAGIGALYDASCFYNIRKLLPNDIFDKVLLKTISSGVD